MRGLILYGPPASGKSTITRLLEEGGGYRPFQRLKVGPGRTEEYVMVTRATLNQLRSAGDVIWENVRYGATYAVDTGRLRSAVDQPSLPVLHLGQPEAVAAVTAIFPPETWSIAELWADVVETESRLLTRKEFGVQARLEAWAKTPQLAAPDIRIDTTQCSPPEAAELVRRCVEENVHPT